MAKLRSNLKAGLNLGLKSRNARKARFPKYVLIWHLLMPEERQAKIFLKGKMRDVESSIINKGYDSLLEVGCAEGYVSRSLLKKNYVNHVVACDIRDEPLNSGRKSSIRENIADKIEFKNCSATDLSEKNKSFDVVMVLDVLEHMETRDDVAIAISEAIRVAKKEVIVSLPQFDIRKPRSYFQLLEPDHFLCVLRNKEMLFMYSSIKFRKFLDNIGIAYEHKKGKCALNYYFIHPSQTGAA